MAQLRILLDIEALVDVRYGWLCNQDETMRDELLFNFNIYCNRNHDDFWLMFPQISEEDCANRGNYSLDDLKAGVRTNVFTLIDDAIRSSEHMDAETTVTTITLNTRHYPLSDNELEAFKVLVSARYEHNIEVNVIRVPVDKMIPKTLHANYDLVIQYDMSEWLGLFWDAVREERYPDLVFYTPFRFPNKVEGDRNFFRLMQQTELEGSYTEIISDAFSPFLQLYFDDIKYFSPIACR